MSSISVETNFAATSAAATTRTKRPPLGHKGEVSEAIEANINLMQFGQISREKWGLYEDGTLSAAHEFVAHPLLALKLFTHPSLMEGMPYQGSYEAEAYVTPIEAIINGSFLVPDAFYFNDPEQFVREVTKTARAFYILENKNRIVAWLLAQSEGASIKEVQEKYGYGAYAFMGHFEGIYIPLGPPPRIIISEKFGEFILYGPGTADGCKTQLPYNLSGSEPLKLYEIPSPNRIMDFYHALLPDIHLIQKYIYAYRVAHDGDVLDRSKKAAKLFPQVLASDPEAAQLEIFSQITVGELIGLYKPENPIPEISAATLLMGKTQWDARLISFEELKAGNEEGWRSVSAALSPEAQLLLVNLVLEEENLLSKPLAVKILAEYLDRSNQRQPYPPELRKDARRVAVKYGLHIG